MSKRILIKVDYSTYVSLPLMDIEIVADLEVVTSDGYGDEAIYRRKAVTLELLVVHEHQIGAPVEPPLAIPAAPRPPHAPVIDRDYGPF